MVGGFRHGIGIVVSRMLTALSGALLLLAVTPAASGQDAGEAPSGQPSERRVLLIVTPAAGAGFTDDSLAVAARAILMGLELDPAVRATGAIFLDAAVGTAPSTDDARSQAASAAGAEGWVWIEVSPAGGGASLHVRTFDAASQAPGLDDTVAVAADLASVAVAAADWTGLAALVARAYPARPGQDGLAAGPSSATVTVHGRPGSRVAVSGAPPVTLDSEGNGHLTLGVPAAYTLRATDPGYAPSSQSLFLTSDREVTFLQAPGARWAMEASLTDGSWPGAALSWLVIPDILSVGLDVSTYLFGLALNDQQVFWSLPLTNLGLRVGVYFAPPDSGFRTYASLAAFTRLIHATQYLGLDPISPLAVRLALGAEIQRGPRGGFFVEYDPVLYVSSLPNLFRASLGSYDIPPGWIFAQGLVLDLLTLRVGYRWTL